MTCRILGRYPVNPDMLLERSKGSFRPDILTHFLEGDEEKTKNRKELGKLLKRLAERRLVWRALSPISAEILSHKRAAE